MHSERGSERIERTFAAGAPRRHLDSNAGLARPPESVSARYGGSHSSNLLTRSQAPPSHEGVLVQARQAWELQVMLSHVRLGRTVKLAAPLERSKQPSR